MTSECERAAGGTAARRPRAPWALKFLAGVGAWLIVGGIGARSAQAYPQWQFSTGVSRCDSCHFAPAGGGLLNGYGRDESGETLSTFSGEGAFLYGAIKMPSWLAVGGDLRGAFVSQDVGDPSGTATAFFPMQADLEARAYLGLNFSMYVVGGLRGQVRQNSDLIPEQNYQPITDSRFISREHWLQWKYDGWYVRAGRFYAPFGLRLAEHVTYIRRDLGFDLLSESYNVSGGYISDQWELHLTAFAPDFLRHMGSVESGGVAYFERRFPNEKGSVAVQSRFASGPGISRLIGGVVGKYYLEDLRTLFMVEADVSHLMPEGTSATSNQFVGLAGVSVLPVRGLILTALAERNQEDLRVSNTSWDAVTGILGWFPAPHSELQLMGRFQRAEGEGEAKTVLLQIHYYL